MKKHHVFLLFSFLLFFAVSVSATEKTIIVRNGGGDSLIEHTLPAVVLAAAENAPYIELHVGMTSDNQLVVFRDLTLNRLTDVANLFPERNREDGNFYVIDFTLQEIRQLRLHNVFETDSSALSMAIPTLQEELALIRRLEKIMGKKEKTSAEYSMGISLEIKQPWFFHDHDRDISSAILDTLQLYGYTDRKSNLFLQCFDPEELQRIHDRLMPARQMDLPLIQMVGNEDIVEARQKILGEYIPYNYDWLFTNSGRRILAGYAAALALPGSLLLDREGNPILQDYTTTLQQYGVRIFAIQLKKRSEPFPAYASDYPSLLLYFLQKTAIDGLYCNSFQRTGKIVNTFEEKEKRKADLPDFFSSLKLTVPPTQHTVTPKQSIKNFNNLSSHGSLPSL
ncbi:glycerophosphoryl diester phosphodiesterase [Desulfomarina profundi]|uniref:Glycerophosphoryl diester phosphodiesterase n=1 Tax=Desulfomarina profundi TaxID=2772557 RepID=A0A8D5JR79_9BACT|nr:glycerophosphodiester phosphodiesterase family protein [Desulfomarina profundi]BCL63275.1 glycerophosphoryl diester phosphodiesterase [Desulfomarina profundi]